MAVASTSTFSLIERDSQSILINSQQTQRQSCWKGKDREQEKSRDRDRDGDGDGDGQQINLNLNLNGHSNHKDGINHRHRTTKSNLQPVEAIGFLLLLLLHLFYHFYLSLFSSIHFFKRFFSPHRQSQSQSQDETPRIPSGLRIPAHLALVLSPPATRTRFLLLRSLFIPNRRDPYQKLEPERKPISESSSSRRESDLLSLLQDAKNVIRWSAMVGTKEVSIYDTRGLLKKQIKRDPDLFDGISIRRSLLEDEDEDSEGEQDSIEMGQHFFSVKVQPFIQENPIHSPSSTDHQVQSITIIPSVQELQERALRKIRVMGLSSSSTSIPSATTATVTSSFSQRTSDLYKDQPFSERDLQSTLATSPLRDYPSQSQIINDSHQPSRTIHIKLNLLSSIDGQPAIARATEEITKRSCERAEGLKKEGNGDRPKEDWIPLEKSGNHITNGNSRESIKERRDSVIKDLTVFEVEKVLRELGSISEPDLLLIHGGPSRARRLNGFPPWIVRLCEIAYNPLDSPSSPLSLPIYIEALQKFSGSEQRFGK